jgi:hypothetical protein
VSTSLLLSALFIIVLLIVQVGLQLTIKRYGRKWSGQKTANTVLLTVPVMATFTAIIIANSFSTIGIGWPPQPIENVESVDSIERAAKRINDLEVHIAHLETYQVYERERQMILVTGLSAIFFVALFTVGLGMYKPTEESD